MVARAPSARRYRIPGRPQVGTFGVEDTHACPCFGRPTCASCGGSGRLYGSASDPSWRLSYPIAVELVPERAEVPDANANLACAHSGQLSLLDASSNDDGDVARKPHVARYAEAT